MFLEEGKRFSIIYFNPNIHPEEEYDKRFDTLRVFCDEEGFELFTGEYALGEWEERVGVHGTDRAARCRACYRLRFEKLAAEARRRGFEAISTTLSVSPWQMTEVIREELERAADESGLVAEFRDFREYYPEATRRSRERGMYRQNYCGCRFSEEEARIEREERKARRKAEKEAKRAAREAAEAASRG